jgi:hypothetical protein
MKDYSTLSRYLAALAAIAAICTNSASIASGSRLWACSFTCSQYSSSFLKNDCVGFVMAAHAAVLDLSSLQLQGNHF